MNEKTLWNGKKIFRRKDGLGRVVLEAAIKESLCIDYRNPQSGRKPMKTLSISGDIECRRGTGGRFSWSGAGQIYDSINPSEYENSQVLVRIINLWKQYHLNDLTAGTITQENILSQFKGRPSGWSYEEDVTYLKDKKALIDQGYTYGNAWLTKPIPSSVLSEIKRLFR